ncbi:MAG: Sec-independent protein translocase subunit TatA [Actinomycetota bacterium]|nr:Sec-independent protein translocase subunit TatA [Actinomycetota bacterium]
MLARAFEGWHIIIVALVVLILFGSKKLPAAARSFGQSLRIFKAETKGLRDDHHEQAEGTPGARQAQYLPPSLPAGQDARDSAAARDGSPAPAETRRDER